MDRVTWQILEGVAAMFMGRGNASIIAGLKKDSGKARERFRERKSNSV